MVMRSPIRTNSPTPNAHLPVTAQLAAKLSAAEHEQNREQVAGERGPVVERSGGPEAVAGLDRSEQRGRQAAGDRVEQPAHHSHVELLEQGQEGNRDRRADQDGYRHAALGRRASDTRTPR